MGTTADKLQYLNGTKTAIKNAIVAKGVAVPDGTTFRQYADKISSIQDVSSLPTQGAKTVTPTTSEQIAVASGIYTTGDVKVAGDANLKAENIAEGVSIFGVTGTHGGEFVTGTFKSGSYYPTILYPTQKESEGYSSLVVGMGVSIIIDEQIPKYSLVFASPGDKLTISGGITRVNTSNFVSQDVNFFFVSGDFTIAG